MLRAEPQQEVRFRACERVDRLIDVADNGVRAAGVSIPLIPGVMPVSNFAGLKRMSASCGAAIPSWLEAHFGGLDDDPETRKLLAAEPLDKGGYQYTYETTIELEGAAKPACVAESLVRRYLLHMGHHGAVGDPAAIHPSGLHTGGRQRLMHLGANAEYHHQAHAQGVQQGQVLNQLLSSARRHGFAFNQDDKGSPPVGIDVRGGITKPVDKGETCVQGPLSGSR